MDVSAYLIPNPWALIAATKDYSVTGMFPHKAFWKLGGIHIPSATSTLKQIHTCALNAVSTYGVVHAVVSANGANPTRLDVDVFQWKR